MTLIEESSTQVSIRAGLLTQEQVHYRAKSSPDVDCSNCTHVERHDPGYSTCGLVEGIVDGLHVCDEFDGKHERKDWGRDLYHGTDAKNAAEIERHGLRPSQRVSRLNPHTAAESHVYLTDDPKRAARWARGGPNDKVAVFKVHIADESKLSSAGSGEFAHEGAIPASQIERVRRIAAGVLDTRDWKTWDEEHTVELHAHGHEWGEAGAAKWKAKDHEVIEKAHEEASHLPAGQSHTNLTSDKAYAEHRDHVEHELVAHGSSDMMHSPYSTHISEDRVDGVEGMYSPEREALHRQIIAEYEDRAKAVPHDHKAIVTAGLGGAGKSTVLRHEAQSGQSVAGKLGIKYDTYDKKGNGVGEPTNFVTLNPDDIKERMAELGAIPKIDALSPMEASPFAHEEASMLTERIAHRLQSTGTNVIHDVTLNSVKSGTKRINPLRSVPGGYHVAGVMVDVSTKQSLANAEQRHRGGQERFAKGIGQGGRYVPSDLIKAAGDPTGHYRSQNRAAFEQLKADHAFDQTFTVDNEGYAGKIIDEASSIAHVKEIAHEEQMARIKAHNEAKVAQLAGARSDGTGDITEHIVAYRKGEMAFQDLVNNLTNRQYQTPSYVHEGAQSMAASEHVDRSEPGTWGEVVAANDKGLLTDDEYDQLHAAVLNAHRSDDEVEKRSWATWGEEHRPYGKGHYTKVGDHEAGEAWARGAHEVHQEHHVAKTVMKQVISDKEHRKLARKEAVKSFAVRGATKRERQLNQAYHEGRAHAHHGLANDLHTAKQAFAGLAASMRIEPGVLDTRGWYEWDLEHPHHGGWHHKPKVNQGYAGAFFGNKAFKAPKKTPEQLAAEAKARAEAQAKAAAESARRAKLAGPYADRDLHAEGIWDKRDFQSRYGGIMFDGEGRILLREPLNHYDGYHWTFSKGHPDAKDEHPTQVAIREAEEETGLHPKIIGHVPGGFGGTSSRNHYYLMQDSGQPFDSSMMNNETQSLAWATPAQADIMISKGTNAQGVYRDRQTLRAAVEAHSALTGTPNIKLAPLGPPPPKPKPIVYKPLKPVKAPSDGGKRSNPEHDPRSTMVSLDLPVGTIQPVPGGLPANEHHITIVYAGKIDDDDFDKVLSAARDVAAKTAPLAGQVGGIGSFPPSQGSDGLTPYYAIPVVPGIEKLRDPLEQFNGSEHTEYHPHVTLTYAENGEPPPAPVPTTPVVFTHLSVHRGGKKHSDFPLTGIRVEPGVLDVRNWTEWKLAHPWEAHENAVNWGKHHHAHAPTIMPDAKSLPVPPAAPMTIPAAKLVQWTKEAQEAHSFKPGSTRAVRFETGYVSARYHAMHTGMEPGDAHTLSEQHDTIAKGLQANQAQAKREGVAAGYHAHSIGFGESEQAAQGKTAAQLRVGDVIMHQGKPMKVTKAPKDWHAAGIKSAKPDEVEVVLKDASMEGGGGEAFDMHKDYEPEMVSHSTKPVLEESQVSAAKPAVAPVGHLGVPTTEDQLKSMTAKGPGEKFSNGETVPKTGTNGGTWYDDGAGNAYFLKGSQSDEHAMNEVAGSLAYQQAGIAAQKVTLVKMNDGSVRALAHYQTGLAPILKLHDTSAQTQTSARNGAGMDALMSHYDLTGLYDPKTDHVDGPNLFTDKQGNVVRLDLGGTGRFRAQGGKKAEWKAGAAWDPDSIRNGDQGQLAYGAGQANKLLPPGMHQSFDQAADFNSGDYRVAMLDAGISHEFAHEQTKVIQARQKQLHEMGFGTQAKPTVESSVAGPTFHTSEYMDNGAPYDVEHADMVGTAEYQSGHTGAAETAEGMYPDAAAKKAIEHHNAAVNAGPAGSTDGLVKNAKQYQYGAADAFATVAVQGGAKVNFPIGGAQTASAGSLSPLEALAHALAREHVTDPDYAEGYEAQSKTIKGSVAIDHDALMNDEANGILDNLVTHFTGGQKIPSEGNNGPQSNASVAGRIGAMLDARHGTVQHAPAPQASDQMGPAAFHAGEAAGKLHTKQLLEAGHTPEQVHAAAAGLEAEPSTSYDKGWAKAAHEEADLATSDVGASNNVPVDQLSPGDIIKHPSNLMSGDSIVPVEVLAHTPSPSGAHFVTTKQLSGPQKDKVEDHIIANGTVLTKTQKPEEFHADGSKLLKNVKEGDTYAGGYKVDYIHAGPDITSVKITGPNGSTQIAMGPDASINQAIEEHELELKLEKKDAGSSEGDVKWTNTNPGFGHWIEHADGSWDGYGESGDQIVHYDPDKVGQLKVSLSEDPAWTAASVSSSPEPVGASERPAGFVDQPPPKLVNTVPSAGKGKNYAEQYVSGYKQMMDRLKSGVLSAPQVQAKLDAADAKLAQFGDDPSKFSPKAKEDGFLGMVDGGKKALADWYAGDVDNPPSTGKVTKHNEAISTKQLVDYPKWTSAQWQSTAAKNLVVGNKLGAVPTLQHSSYNPPGQTVLGVVENKKDASKVDITSQDAKGVVHQFTLGKDVNVKAQAGEGQEPLTPKPHPVETSVASGTTNVMAKDLKVGDKVLSPTGNVYTVTKTFPGETPFVSSTDDPETTDLDQLNITGVTVVQKLGSGVTAKPSVQPSVASSPTVSAPLPPIELGKTLMAKASPVKFTSDFESSGEPFHQHPGYHNEAYDVAYEANKTVENPSNSDLAAADQAQQNAPAGTEESAAAKGKFNGLQAAQVAWAKAHKSEAQKQQEKEYIEKVAGSYTAKAPFEVHDEGIKPVPSEIPHGKKPDYATSESSVGYDQAIAQGYDQAVAAYLSGHTPEQIQYAVEQHLNKADAVGTDLTNADQIMEQAHYAGLAQGAGKAAVDLAASGGDIQGHHPNASSKSILQQGILADKSGHGAYKSAVSGNPFKDKQSNTQLSFDSQQRDDVRTWKQNYRYSKGAAYVKAVDAIGAGKNPGSSATAQKAKRLYQLYIEKAEPNKQPFQRKVKSHEIPASVIEQWKQVGDEVDIPLTSWSTDPNAWSGDIWLHAPPGTVSMDIGKIENYESEVETISGGRFKILKVEVKGGITHIYLEQTQASAT